MTLSGGRSCTAVSASCDGGAIYNTGTLTLDGVLFTGNAAAAGADQSTPGSGLPGGDGRDAGGIYNARTGSLTAIRSLIVGNAAGAGGAGADRSGNAGADGGRGGNGGAIMNAGGALDLVDSTIADNTAGAGGTGGLGDPWHESRRSRRKTGVPAGTPAESRLPMWSAAGDLLHLAPHIDH